MYDGMDRKDNHSNRNARIRSYIMEEKQLKEQLEQTYGTVWNTKELQENFEVIGFQAPYVVVKRKSDGVLGSLEFTHMPRFYFNFKRD